MTSFADGPMAGLVDSAVRYDLAESTSPDLRLRDVVDPQALADLTLGYGTSRGDEDARDLLAAGTGVAADQVLVTVGAAEAMFLVAQDTCGPGTRAALTTPCFPPTRIVPEGLGAKIDAVALRFDDGYRLDLDGLAAALGPETRLVTVATPQNPAGVAFTRDELQALVALVDERAPEAVVLVDETYRVSTYGDAAPPASAATLSPRVVTCGSLSKAHGAPGLRFGWLTCTDAERYERLRNAKFQTTIACSTTDAYLAVQVLRLAPQVLAERGALLARALDELTAWADGGPFELVRPDGGALCCLRLRSDAVPDDAVPGFYERLAERETRVAPGSWFGADDRVFRLGFGHLPPTEFTEALARLADAV